jgi:S1-C subfamily serine protease
MEIPMTAAPDLAPLTALSASLSGLIAAAAPSVVAVHSHRARSSGFLWKPGLIVTADEALADEGDVAVTLSGGKRVAAIIAGRDPTTDIALLRAETGDTPSAAFTESAPPAGALAVTVGSREGEAVASLGLVAASGPAWRSMRGGEIAARIDLDLSLRRHAEGGLALDASGRAFGMAVFGPRHRVLVIPAATVTRVGAQLETHGKVPRGYLGLGLHPVRLDRGGGGGAMVMSVDAEGPGAKAGVHQGDILQAWDGHQIGSVGALLRALGPGSVGKTVALSLRRGGETRAVVLEIGERA